MTFVIQEERYRRMMCNELTDFHKSKDVGKDLHKNGKNRRLIVFPFCICAFIVIYHSLYKVSLNGMYLFKGVIL